MKKEIILPKGVVAKMYQDGDRIVIEYEEVKQEFKRGDCVIGIDSCYPRIAKFVESIKDEHICKYDNGTNECSFRFLRLATEPEKQQAIDALHKIGKDWDAENMEVVDLVWRPMIGEKYFYPALSIKDRYFSYENGNTSIDKYRMEHGIAFSTKEEAIACTEKMLKSVKP